MLQEGRRRAVGHRPAGHAPSSAQADPAGFEKRVERALRGRDAADLLDLRPGHGLVIGDDRKGLHGGTGQLTLLHHVAGEER